MHEDHRSKILDALSHFFPTTIWRVVPANQPAVSSKQLESERVAIGVYSVI